MLTVRTTVYEYLYIARIRGMGKSEQEHAIEKISTQCQITDRHQPIGELSGAQATRRTGSSAHPSIVILDEPPRPDPNQIVEMCTLIKIGK